MSNQNSTRIWENDSSASPPNSSPARSAQLPSIATLTNTLPSASENPASPAFSNNRSSDQWATPPQSTRKLDRVIMIIALLTSFRQDLRHTPLGSMAIINPPRSVRPIEHPIPVNLELRHIHLAFPTTHKHLQGLLLLSIAWASRRSTSNTKIPLNTEAAMNFPHRILAVAVLAAKSTGSIIYT